MGQIFIKMIYLQTMQRKEKSDMKEQEYTLTAVFISTDYGRLEDVKTLTVTS